MEKKCIPVLPVKKDWTSSCWLDRRYLNDLTVKGTFPIPVFNQLAFQRMLVLHPYSFCWIPSGASEGERRTHDGLFNPLIWPLYMSSRSWGLTGAPDIFESAMNITLAPLLRKCVVFFVNILVFSPTYEQHLQYLGLVFALLQAEHWHSKLSKCKMKS